MICRKAIVSVLFSCMLSATTATAQTGDRYMDMRAGVLDLVFPLDFASEPYLQKLILRFGILTPSSSYSFTPFTQFTLADDLR